MTSTAFLAKSQAWIFSWGFLLLARMGKAVLPAPAPISRMTVGPASSCVARRKTGNSCCSHFLSLKKLAVLFLLNRFHHLAGSSLNRSGHSVSSLERIRGLRGLNEVVDVKKLVHQMGAKECDTCLSSEIFR